MKKNKKIKRKSCSRKIREEMWKNLTDISHNTTRQQYRLCVNRFVAYCRDTYNCMSAGECGKHIQDYANYLQEQGKSHHTIHTYIAGICHACEVPMAEIQKPRRVNADNIRGRSFIKRTNYRTDMDLDNEQWNRITEFQKVAGLRRAELQKLTKESLAIDESGYLCLRVIGKGGRLQLQRVSTQKAGVEKETEDLIYSYFTTLQPQQPVFRKEELKNKLNLHRLRALKAQSDYGTYLHRVQTEPAYREQLIQEIKARWKLYGRILGETVFDDDYVPLYNAASNEYELVFMERGTIIIDASLLRCRSDGRLRFTCAHELAHWLIHQELYCGSGDTAAMLKSVSKSSDVDKSIERQADMLGSDLLLPLCLVKKAFYRVTGADRIEYLAQQFEVSKKAMEIRLREHRLI